MQNKIFRTTKDVLGSLAKLDFDLEQFKLKNKIQLIIFGGTALLLKTNLHVTGDIDAIIRMDKEDIKVRKLLAKYTINDKMAGVMELPPIEDVYMDVSQLNVDFKNITVLMPSAEHLIISKLFTTRQTNKDVEDIIKSEILAHANINKLRKLYNEYLNYTILPKYRYNDLEAVLEQWNHYKEGGKMNR